MGTALANNPKVLQAPVRRFCSLPLLLRFGLMLLFLDFLFLVLCLVFFPTLVTHHVILSWLFVVFSLSECCQITHRIAILLASAMRESVKGIDLLAITLFSINISPDPCLQAEAVSLTGRHS